jgi:hypothetical protein
MAADWDLTKEEPQQSEQVPITPSSPILVSEAKPYDPGKDREGTRAALARSLLLLLAFSIGGVLFFIGMGRLEGTVLTQSVFPQLITLVGTALGFYFGSQSGTNNNSTAPMLPSTTVQPNSANSSSSTEPST